MFLEASQADAHSRALTVVLGLAPTLLGAGVKWMQENSRSKRRYQLSERLAGLSKMYGEQQPCDDAVLIEAREVLRREITAASAELSVLQAESTRVSSHGGYAWLRDAFLLFLPHGLLAWCIHLIFYSGVVLVLLAILGLSLGSENQDTVSGAIGVLAIGVLLLLLQRWAIWLRKRHEKSVQDREISAVMRPTT